MWKVCTHLLDVSFILACGRGSFGVISYDFLHIKLPFPGGINDPNFLSSLPSQSFLDVIIELEKLDVVSPERVDVVEECLIDIGRLDLAKKVTAYKTPGETLFTF